MAAARFAGTIVQRFNDFVMEIHRLVDKQMSVLHDRVPDEEWKDYFDLSAVG